MELGSLFWYLFSGAKALRSEDSEPENRHDLAHQWLGSHPGTFIDINMQLLLDFFGMPEDSATKDLLKQFDRWVLVSSCDRITAKEALHRLDSYFETFSGGSREVPSSASSAELRVPAWFVEARLDYTEFANDHSNMISRIPALPVRGNLDISCVRDSQYFFS